MGNDKKEFPKREFIIDNEKDIKLIEEFNNGNEDALRELIEEYKAIVNYYIDYYCVRNSSLLDKKELYQLSLLSLYHCIQKYDVNVNCSFSTFFSLILKREIVIYIRKMKNLRNRSNLYNLSLNEVIAESNGIYRVDTIPNQNPNFEPQAKLELDWFYEDVEQKLQQFDDIERKVFRMWMHGYTYVEIGKTTKLSLKKIEYIIRKIKSQLKNTLQEWKEE